MEKDSIMELVQKKKRINPLCQLLGIEKPIIQAPMAGNIIPAQFTADVCNAGLLGSLASGYLSFEDSLDLIVNTQKKTQNPFQLNLFIDQSDKQKNTEILRKPDELIVLEHELNMHHNNQIGVMPEASVDAMVSLAIECDVPIISTTFGLLSPKQIKKVKKAGTILMTTINSLADAHMAMILNEPEVLIYQNKLAGGHQGGFNKEEGGSVDISDNAILALKKEYPGVLIVKSGAIVTREDIESALRQGFDGVQIGTAFLATNESLATAEHKQAILDTNKVCDTCFSKNVTGKSARGIKNKLMQLLLKEEPNYPQQHYATLAVRAYAKANALKEYQALWAGTGAVKIEKIPSLNEYIESILEHPATNLNRMQRMRYDGGATDFQRHG